MKRYINKKFMSDTLTGHGSMSCSVEVDGDMSEPSVCGDLVIHDCSRSITLDFSAYHYGKDKESPEDTLGAYKLLREQHIEKIDNIIHFMQQFKEQLETAHNIVVDKYTENVSSKTKVKNKRKVKFS